MSSHQSLPRIYLLDTNVFLHSFLEFYSMDICPGFWDFLASCAEATRIASIDKVESELGGESDLTEWMKAELPGGFFQKTDDLDVQMAYQELMAEVNGWGFQTDEVLRFASGADGWLVAYAKVHSMAVVTHEVHNPPRGKTVKNKALKIPALCSEYGVECMGTFQMLKQLAPRFVWTGVK